MYFIKRNLVFSLLCRLKNILFIFVYILPLIIFLINDFRYLRYFMYYETEQAIPEILKPDSSIKLKSNCECKRDIIKINNYKDKHYVEINNGRTYEYEKAKINVGSTTCNLYNTLRRGIEQKIISYSLYGTNPRYYNNLKKIAKQAKKVYPDWTIRIHHDDSINLSVICEIECLKNDETGEYLDNVDFCDMNRIPYGSQVETWNANYINKMIWRWLPIGDPFVDIFISRDSDSPLSQREVDAVNEWLNSKTLFHIMRDHPSHGEFFVGCCWGYVNHMNRQLSNKLYTIMRNHKIAEMYNYNKHGPDQDFLRDYLWKIAKLNSTIHDSYTCVNFGGIGFPSKRPDYYCFVGCIGDCCNNDLISKMNECPQECRPKNHQDWIYC